MYKKLLFLLVLFCAAVNAQWVQTAYRGSAYCFAVSPATSGTGSTNLFAGTVNGVFLTTNNGTSWTAINAGLPNRPVGSLAVIGTNLFAGTAGAGVFLLTNNDTSWTAANNGLTNANVSAFAVSITGASGVNLFAGTLGNGIYVSTNNGTSWLAVDSGLSNTDIRVLTVSSNGLIGGIPYLVAGTSSGVFLSTNNGTSWTTINAGLPNRAVGSLAVSPTGIAGTNLFAGTAGAGVFLSTNNGTKWTATSLTGASVQSFAVIGTNLFAGTAAGSVFLSTNNGTSWAQVDSGLTSASVNSLAVIGTSLFAATDSGVWVRPLSEMFTGVKNKQNNFPTSFSLQQNYPNPFNPTTMINYSVPKTSLVTIKVYDILGKEIATLVNEEKSAGNYSVQFSANGGYASGRNGGNLSSGIYFYRMQSGNYSQTKKLVLLK